MFRSKLLVISVLLICLAPTTHAQSIEEFNRDDPPIQQTTPQTPATPDLDRVERMIVRRTNRFRENHGREPVQVNPQLEETAEYFAGFMARTEKYGHRADGQRPSQRATQHGYEYCIVSENIAYRYSSAGFETQELAKGFLRGWKTSQGHRENMLDPHVTEIGVAVAHSPDTGNYYAVQMFGRPRSASIQFRVTNRAGEPVEYTVSPTYGEGARSFDLAPRITRTHERCRPTVLQFAFAPSRSIAVEDGMAYTVTTDAAGEMVVRSEPFSADDPAADDPAADNPAADDPAAEIPADEE